MILLCDQVNNIQMQCKTYTNISKNQTQVNKYFFLVENVFFSQKYFKTNFSLSQLWSNTSCFIDKLFTNVQWFIVSKMKYLLGEIGLRMLK